MLFPANLPVAEIWRKKDSCHLYLAENWRKIGCMKSYPYLEKYGIPHKIQLTDKLVGFLMEIAEQRPFLEESIGSALEVQLLRKAKIRHYLFQSN